MKLPTLLGILDTAILKAPAGPNEQPAPVTLALGVAQNLREEIMSLALEVAADQKHRLRLETAIVSLQRCNDSYTLAFETLETSLTTEIARQKIYTEQLKHQLDFSSQSDAAAAMDAPHDDSADFSDGHTKGYAAARAVSKQLTDALNAKHQAHVEEHCICPMPLMEGDCPIHGGTLNADLARERIAGKGTDWES